MCAEITALHRSRLLWIPPVGLDVSVSTAVIRAWIRWKYLHPRGLDGLQNIDIRMGSTRKQVPIPATIVDSSYMGKTLFYDNM